MINDEIRIKQKMHDTRRHFNRGKKQGERERDRNKNKKMLWRKQNRYRTDTDKLKESETGKEKKRARLKKVKQEVNMKTWEERIREEKSRIVKQ